MPITEKILECSTSLSAAADRFMDEVGDWIESCIWSYGDDAPGNGRGQMTYTASWEPYLRLRPSKDVTSYLTQQRDEIRDHFTEQDEWNHGYWRREDVRQGTEHFRVFLTALARLDPADSETHTQLMDAAEHIGNWNDEVPAWHEPSNGLFRSLELGSNKIDEASTGWNMPDHLNLAALCLTAYEIGGGDQYMELANNYAVKWADAVLAAVRLPVGINSSGPFYELNRRAEQIYRSVKEVAGTLNNDQDRAENILANGGIDLFLKLWTLTGDDRFRIATEKLLNVMLPQLTDPDAGALADILRLYRTTTGDTRYDDAIRAAVDILAPYDIRTIGLQPNVMRLTRSSGIGKRADMPVWFEDMHLRRHNPVLLSIAAEINGDATLAALSLDLARTYFELARDTLREGRQNGDAANTVCAVARGHGRENGSGMITAVLVPLLEAAIPVRVSKVG